MVALLAMLIGAGAAATAAVDQPNFVFVLADDLDFDYKQDRKLIMPTLKRELADGGLQFINHVAAYPVCGPSRSSLLASRFPHNTGYVANGAKASVAHWAKLQNHTIGSWFTAAGYYTAFLGKYVNGMECDVPSGWRHWGGLTCTHWKGMQLGGTYNYYNASQWQVDFDVNGTAPITHPIAPMIWSGTHQADFLGNQSLVQMRKADAEGRPFFLHVTPVMVHGGFCQGFSGMSDDWARAHLDPTDPYFEHHNPDPTIGPEGTPKGTLLTGSPCPSHAHAWDFPFLKNPHLPSWGAFANGTTPAHIAQEGDPDGTGCCDDWEADRQDHVYRNRSAAVVDLDALLSTIFGGIDALGKRDTTYFWFSSDNGYHLGEHRLLYGKTEPYETDTRLPMYVTGPGVPRGEVRLLPTNHLDLTATIAHLGGVAKHSPHPLDGQSFVGALTATPPAVADWRSFSFSEFYVQQNTWRMIRLVDDDGVANATFHWWCTNQSEAFDLTADAYQMNNLAGDAPSPWGKAMVERYLAATEVLGSCVHAECHVMPPPGTASANPLKCHDSGELLDVDEVWLDP